MTSSTEKAEPTRVFAVIVSYGPDPSRFSKVVAAASEQVTGTIVVDNGQGRGLSAVQHAERVEVIDMGGNVGIARAHNVGIQRAWNKGATHVLILDHDSIAGAAMTERLLDAWKERSRLDNRVAAVGANYHDPRRPSSSPFIQLEGWRLRRMPRVGVVPVSYVISSGCLISRSAYDAVGPMNECLFIDYVDIEWGLRANTVGWKCFGVGEAVLEHTLGDAPLMLFGVGYPLHSPLRHYYMVRNAVWILIRCSFPLGWKAVESWHLIRRILAYAVFAPERHRHIKEMASGLIDGIRGRMGGKQQLTSG